MIFDLEILHMVGQFNKRCEVVINCLLKCIIKGVPLTLVHWLTLLMLETEYSSSFLSYMANTIPADALAP